MNTDSSFTKTWSLLDILHQRYKADELTRDALSSSSDNNLILTYNMCFFKNEISSFCSSFCISFFELWKKIKNNVIHFVFLLPWCLEKIKGYSLLKNFFWKQCVWVAPMVNVFTFCFASLWSNQGSLSSGRKHQGVLHQRNHLRCNWPHQLGHRC